MIVTTGGRSTRSSAASWKPISTSTSSAAWTISICLSNSSASTPIASSDSVCVSVAISPSVISFLITSGTATPRYSATSLTVEPELTRIRSVASIAAVSIGAIVSSYVPRRRRPRRGRLWGWLAGPPCWRREACESITTRRRPPGPTSPGVRSPVRESRVGRTRSAAAAAAAAAAAGAVGDVAAPVGEACAAAAVGAGAGGEATAAGAGLGALGGRSTVAAATGAAAGAGALATGAAAAPFERAGAAAPSSPSTFSAVASSTEEAAALASTPAAWSFSSSSLLERPCALAISCTRFLLIDSPILRAWGRRSPRSAARGRSLRGAVRAPCTRGRARRDRLHGRGRRRDRASCRRGRARRAGSERLRGAIRGRSARCGSDRPSARCARSRRSVARGGARLWRRLLVAGARRYARGRLGGGGGLLGSGGGLLAGGSGGGLGVAGIDGHDHLLLAALGGEVADVVAVDVGERLVGVEAAVARAGQRGVGTAPAV